MTASSDEDIFSRISFIFKVKIGTLFLHFNNFVRVGFETLSGVSSLGVKPLIGIIQDFILCGKSYPVQPVGVMIVSI